MSSEYMQNTTIEVEKTREIVGTVIARLGDLGLGNPEGIPSKYADTSMDELGEIAEKEARKLVYPTDITATACIDGRKTLGNSDGSPAQVRLRRVGGSASNLGVALNAEASITDTLSPEDPLWAQVKVVDDHVKQMTGFEPSAHKGGCGGANGEIQDDEAIHISPEVMEAAKALLSIPLVKGYFAEGHEELQGQDIYDESLAKRIREASAKTAEFLRDSGWDGQEYVDTVANGNPRCVEELEVDHDDKKFHGHREPALLIVVGDKTVEGGDNFVWNLKATKMVAEGLAGQRGDEGYKQAVIAETAKHMAVGGRLPSDKTPVMLLAA